MKMQSLLKHVNVLNLLLSGVIAVFAGYILMPMFNVKVTFVPIRAKATAVETHREPSSGDGQQAVPPLIEYTVIAEQNVFHPDRKIPPLKQPDKVVPKPDFVLYGTLIADTVSLAYMSDKKAVRSTPGRGPRQTALKVGDNLSGYTLKEITQEKVVMIRGEERMEVKVITSEKSKTRNAAAAPAPGGAPPLMQSPEAGLPGHEEQGAGSMQPPPQRPVPPQRPQPSTMPRGGKTGTWKF